jgi:hypothetical protein
VASRIHRFEIVSQSVVCALVQPVLVHNEMVLEYRDATELVRYQRLCGFAGAGDGFSRRTVGARGTSITRIRGTGACGDARRDRRGDAPEQYEPGGHRVCCLVEEPRRVDRRTTTLTERNGRSSGVLDLVDIYTGMLDVT